MSEEWTEEKLQEFLKYLSRHLVAIVGKAQIIKVDGTISLEREWADSGTVVSLGDDWYVLSAGHCITRTQEALQNPQHRLTPGNISFGFGKDAITTEPFAFPKMDRKKAFIYDKAEGLDYVLYPLTSIEKACFITNKIIAMPLHPDSRPDPSTYEKQYFGVGFPREATEPGFDENFVVNAANIRPDAFPLDPMTDDYGAKRPWLKAKIVAMGDVQSYVGVSGGPIFGFVKKDGKLYPHLVAIQSWWEKDDKIAYGCLTDEIYKHALPKIEEWKAS